MNSGHNDYNCPVWRPLEFSESVSKYPGEYDPLPLKKYISIERRLDKKF